jgi:hypothetical protein
MIFPVALGEPVLSSLRGLGGWRRRLDTIRSNSVRSTAMLVFYRNGR